MTKKLFLKYIDSRCNPQEKSKAEEWLRSCTPEQLDHLMMQVWDDTENPVMPEAEADEMWKTLSATIMKQPAGRVINLFSLKKWAVAVAALAVLAIGIVWASQKNQAHVLAQKTQKPAAESPVVNWAYSTNTDVKEKLMTLEDGSEVWLFPKSTLTYRTIFGKDRRDLFLDGKAIFHVAKDANRPFTVYSGDIATTALGTKFLVDALSINSTIHVKLYEGKIVVKQGKYPLKSWTKQEFLLPGDELNYNINSQATTVQHKKSGKEKYSIAKPFKELVFTNEELKVVFEKIQQLYRVNIKYNKADIKGMYFTGSISQGSSVNNSLKVITQMNGLSLKEEDGKYIIRKTE